MLAFSALILSEKSLTSIPIFHAIQGISVLLIWQLLFFFLLMVFFTLAVLKLARLWNISVILFHLLLVDCWSTASYLVKKKKSSDLKREPNNLWVNYDTPLKCQITFVWPEIYNFISWRYQAFFFKIKLKRKQGGL